YWFMKRDMKNGKWNDGLVTLNKESAVNVGGDANSVPIPMAWKKWLAIVILLLFAMDVVVMFMFNLQGDDATALIGGTAVFILVAVTLLAHRNKGLEEVTSYIIEGLQFGFKVFGPVIPIAAFFYLGDSAFTALFQ